MLVRRTIVSLLFSLTATFVAAQPAWQPFVTSIGGSMPVGAAFLNEQYGFVTTANNRVYRTTDGGATWTRMLVPAAFIGLGPVYFHTPADIFLYGTYESTDSGATWTTLPNPARWADQSIYAVGDNLIDCQGRLSTDRSWSWGQIHLPTGETVAGNLDKSIAVWGGSSGGLSETAYSTDGGITWNVGQTGIEADYGYAFPFTLTYIRAGGDGGYGTPGASAIQRSLDGGATWQSVFGPFPGLGLDDGLWGDACVVYTQTKLGSYPSGVLRSTDQGSSWTAIGGPSAGNTRRDDQPLCGACSRGTVCYAINTLAGRDTIWKFTDRKIYSPIFADTRINANFSDTLVISECDSALLAIRTLFSACDYIRIQNLTIENFVGGTSSVRVTANKIIHTDAPDTSYATLRPSIPGTYNVRVHLHYCGSDWSGVDTTFPVVVVIKPSIPKLLIDKSTPVDFGTMPLCLGGGLDTIRLSVLGCRPVVIKRTWIQTDSVTSLDYSVTTLVNDSVRSSGGGRTLILDFHPSSSGKKPATLVIETNIGDFTIPIDATILPDAHALLATADTIRAPLCQSGDGILRVANPTCRKISIDSMAVPLPFMLAQNQLPLLLKPGDTALLAVRFAPVSRGPVSVVVPVHMSLYEPSLVVSFDTTLIMSAVGLRGLSADSISISSLSFDSLHLCESSVRTVTLYSTGCDSLLLSSVRLQGDSDFALGTWGPRDLAPGDSVVLTVSLAPSSTGTKTATIQLSLDRGRTVTIPISATALRAVRRLTLDSVGTLNFGSCWICDQPTSTITLRNPGCDSVVISDANWTDRAFWIVTPLPIVIPPGGVRSIRIIAEPDTSGTRATNRSVLTLVTNADSAIAPVPCALSIQYPRTVRLWLEYVPVQRSAGQLWTAALKSDPGELDSLRTLDFDLIYNSDLLGYQWCNSMNSYLPVSEHRFHFEGAPFLTLDSNNTIAELTFEAYLTTDTTTNVELGNVRFNSDDSVYTGCHALAFTAGATFDYRDLCGHPTIRRFMAGEPPAFRIVPNPSQGEVVITSSKPTDGVRAQVVNVGGQTVFDGYLLKDSPTSFRLPASVELAGGSYYLDLADDNGPAAHLTLIIRK